MRRKGGSKSQQDMRIRDVWASNLKEEMDLLEQLVEKYHYISMVRQPLLVWWKHYLGVNIETDSM